MRTTIRTEKEENPGGRPRWRDGRRGVLHRDVFPLCSWNVRRCCRSVCPRSWLNVYAEKGVRVFSLPVSSMVLGSSIPACDRLLPIIILREHVQIVLVNGLLESVLLIPARLLGCEAIYARTARLKTTFISGTQPSPLFSPVDGASCLRGLRPT